MKPLPEWLNVSGMAAAVLLGMVLVMWAQSPGPGCALAPEGPRRLVLSRETDREHLAADRESADRIARRYRLSIADPAQQAHQGDLFANCEATLIQQIAERHGLTLEQVRASFTDAPQP